MAQAAATLFTTGDIARQERVPKYRVEYAIDTYGIRETQRIGIVRVFDNAKVEAIRSALRRIAERGKRL